MSVSPTLRGTIEALEALYGAAPPPISNDPFELVIWENVVYLADDERRKRGFEKLRETVGTNPEQILRAPRGQLVTAAREGILADQVATKLRTAAKMAMDEFDGDVARVLRRPVASAKRALRQFPGIGEPGAEKILLFTRMHPFLAPDSNGLRVLVRLGLCPENSHYGSTYRSARELAQEQIGDNFESLISARYVLRRHGQEICRRTTPVCDECWLASECPSVQSDSV